jgi:hypothetical protein
MTPCPQCGGEMPYSAVECNLCGYKIAEPVASVEPVPPPIVEPVPTMTASSRPSSTGSTRLMALAVAIIGGGTVMLGLLMASSEGPKTDTAATSAQTRTLVQTPPVASQAKSTSKRWNSTNREWVGNQRKAVAFELPAEHKVAIWQRNVEPTLVVRCIANRIDAFVFTQSAVKLEPQDDNHTVRLRFDDGPEVVERWPDSDEHDALFAPDGAAFAHRLSMASTMRFGFTPHNASPVTAEFNISGLSAMIEPVAKQCGWKK